MLIKPITVSEHRLIEPIAELCYDSRYTIKGAFHGVPVIYLPMYELACCVKTKIDTEQVHIVIGELFDELSTQAQRWVLYHELGHAMDKMKDYHTLSDDIHRLRRTYIDNGLVAPWEARADLFALHHVGKDAIDAFIETDEMLRGAFGETDTEMVTRLANLKYHIAYPSLINLDNFAFEETSRPAVPRV